MTDKEFFIQTVSDEQPRFERVFKALPADKLGYKHPGDEKAKGAGELAFMMACEAGTFPTFLETGIIDMSSVNWAACASIDDAVAMTNDALMKAKDMAGSMTEAQWASEAKMLAGEKEEWKTTRGGMSWGLLLDLIHHRGQLSTYIRPMGGKVPSIYGPSGDTQ